MAAQAIAIANMHTYLQRVERLYSDVRTWMKALEPDARFFETDIELNEQATGPYTAKCLQITRTPRLSLRFVPRGRYILGAEGHVDVHSDLGWEHLLWVEEGAPEIGFRFLPETGPAPEELRGEPMFPGIAAGWAWADQDRLWLEHLDLRVFQKRILNNLGSNA